MQAFAGSREICVVCGKIWQIIEDPATGLTITENFGKMAKIKLDLQTPCAAPRNCLALT